MRIAVIGDLIIDEMVTGRVDRISPEAPVPVFIPETRQRTLGGAGNVAANIAGLAPDADVMLFCSVGPDHSVPVPVDNLHIYPIADVRPPRKRRIVSGGQQLIRIDSDDTITIDEADANRRWREGSDAFDPDVVVVADYLKGTCLPDVIDSVMMYKWRNDAPVYVDAKPGGPSEHLYDKATLRKYNRKEAGLTDIGTPTELFERTEHLRRDSQTLVVTLDRDGAYYDAPCGEPSRSIGHVEAGPVDVVDVTGAGDTFLAALVVALQSSDLPTAIESANRASAVAIGQRGTTIVRRGAA